MRGVTGSGREVGILLGLGLVALVVEIAAMGLVAVQTPLSSRQTVLLIAVLVCLACAALGERATQELHGLARTLARSLAIGIVMLGLVGAVAAQPLASAWAERAFADYLASDTLEAVARRHSYRVGDGSEIYPQVTRPEGEVDDVWIGSEHDRHEGAPLSPGARGLLVGVSADGTLSVEPAQALLGDRAARNEAEVAWVGFVSRVWPISYPYEDGYDALAERVDVRLVDVGADVVLARLSIGRVPPMRRERPVDRYGVLVEVLARQVIASLEQDRVVPIEAPPWDAEGCPSPQTLEDDTVSEPPIECLEGATVACLESCREGVRAACHAGAFTLDHASPARARPLYALACRAGSANACTNFGAGLLLLGLAEDAEVCARGLFERTCTAGEYWGCGMLGGMLARGQGGPEDDLRARAVLEGSCEDELAFSCEVLGRVLRGGELGEADAVGALAAFERACELEGRACDLAADLRAE